MPELVERGHIYIAQPPLYKLKKGKQEQYIKDNDALETYLISNAIDELELHISAEAPAIRGEALANVIADYQTSQKSLARLTQRYPASCLMPYCHWKALSWISWKTKTMWKHGVRIYV